MAFRPFRLPGPGSDEIVRPSARAMLHLNASTRRKPLVLTFVGLRESACRSALARAFPRARFVPRQSDRAVAGSDLIIRVFNRGDSRGRRAFTRAATQLQIASLGVEVGRSGIFIGPLTLPGHAGCGYCG